MDKYPAPSVCPVCSGSLEITALTCNGCGSELRGKFSGCDFCSLSAGDKSFLLVFIKNRGNIKEIEKELGISYPTVRSKLDNIIAALGLKAEPVADQTREEVLSMLERGEISVQEAVKMLK